MVTYWISNLMGQEAHKVWKDQRLYAKRHSLCLFGCQWQVHAFCTQPTHLCKYLCRNCIECKHLVNWHPKACWSNYNCGVGCWSNGRMIGSSSCITFTITWGNAAQLWQEAWPWLLQRSGCMGRLESKWPWKKFLRSSMVSESKSHLPWCMFLGKEIEEQDLGFFVIKFLFITTIQASNSP